ncbi:MAG: DUF6464 family protein [Cyanobacteria bacterium]|nr:DUF6464 family protein [Cyanobacteriota bacterium]MDA1246954.1 DUF6464 family protein [Cyanobacteriota bacterium]
MRVELRQIGSDRLLDWLEVPVLAEVPHPGRWLEAGGRSFLVLQRRHRYQLRNGLYELASVALQVKPQRQPTDARWWQNQWVIGNPDCRFNARSPLLRCAVLPDGPCERCSHFAGP